MRAPILNKLDSLADEHPHRLLYSYIDLNGNQIEGYSYESFVHRTKVIAGYLRKEYRFAAQDRVLLAYPPGLEMICAFFGCVRAGLIPVPVYPPSSHGFQARPVQNGPHRKGLPGNRCFNEHRLPRFPAGKSRQERSLGIRSRRRLHFRSALDRDGQISSIAFRTKLSTAPPATALRSFCFSSTHRGRPETPKA